MKYLNRNSIVIIVLLFLCMNCSDNGGPNGTDGDGVEIDRDLLATWASVRTCPGGGSQDTLTFTLQTPTVGNLKAVTVDCNDSCPGIYEGRRTDRLEQKDENVKTVIRTATFLENCGNEITPTGESIETDYEINGDTLVWGANLAEYVKLQN